ncbi:MAG TPA: serine/threonine-protein kinase [Longimicrobium sp.]|jgi:serine/threonine-protein kinase
MYGIAGLLTGRTLAGRYLIEAVIGRGGMGAVYRAVDERLSRPVAVKVIGTATVDPAEHARLRQRFHREARAAAALHHANVVQVHDFGTDPELDLDFLVMELLRGEDLAARLVRTGPPPLAVSLFILRHAARGLAAGHRAGMVHRDVKPGNIFLETEGDEARVKVLDFGIAQVESEEGTLTHLTQFGRSPFSPAYASPEQLRGEEAITPASDVFSLAAVGYQLATGRRPFTAAEPARVAAELAESLRLLKERAPALDDATAAVLVRGLAWDPAERYADAGLMADALEGRPVAAAAPAAARPSAPAPARPAVDLGDQTKLYAPGPTSSTPEMRPAAARPAAEQTQLAPPPAARRPIQASFPGADQVPQRRPAAPPAAAPAHLPPQGAPYAAQPRRPGPVRRFFRALWDFTVTTVALALFVGAWATAIMGVANGDERRVYLGAAASVLLTPLAVHRLTGRRGRYGFGVAGSILATIGAVYAVGMDADPAIGLAAIFGLQILACFAMSWLTRRKPRDEEAWQAGA